MDIDKQRKENEKKWHQIVARAWMDPKFKKELIAHPDRVFKEHGIDLHGKKINILENTQNESYFVLPSKPSHLSEADLKKMNAAGCYSSFTYIN